MEQGSDEFPKIKFLIKPNSYVPLRLQSITLGRLIGVSNILELLGKSLRGRRAEALRGKKSYSEPEKGSAAQVRLSKEDAAFICVEALDTVPQRGLVFEDRANHVFHIVTDRLNYATMRMWFLANSPSRATIQVQNIEEFMWLNSSYCPVFKQLGSLLGITVPTLIQN